jgi:heme/copper-type cytochrome/quinol oxidase subunit 2
MPETAQGSTRDAVRWVLLLAAVAVSGYRLPATFRGFQQWREALPADPSAADLYKANFTANAVGIVIILGVVLCVFYFLRARAAKQP